MAIKVSLDRQTVPLPFTDMVAEHVYGNAIKRFEIAPRPLEVLATLPFYHQDPVDRLLIAHGQAEDIPLLRREPAFDESAIRRLWA